MVLGDTQIATPERILRDERIARIGTAHRQAYRARLRDGRGFDPAHNALLQKLQQEQHRHRNRDGGYWIAEAIPEAATRALVQQLSRATTPWLVLATDGAYRTMGPLGLDDWSRVATIAQEELRSTLNECRAWVHHRIQPAENSRERSRATTRALPSSSSDDRSWRPSPSAALGKGRWAKQRRSVSVGLLAADRSRRWLTHAHSSNCAFHRPGDGSQPRARPC